MKRPIRLRPDRKEIQRVAENIYVYGYPLLLMEIIRNRQTAVSHPTFGCAPINQFAHRRFPTAPYEKDEFHPYVDSLRSSAWLDLGKGPVVLSVPCTDRYYLLSLWSGWYEIFETIGRRQTGTDGGEFVIIGPRWSGELPPGLKSILAPTEMVWIDGCFEVGAAEDISTVHSLQNEFTLRSLTELGPSSPPRNRPFLLGVDQAISPQEQLSALGGRAFYKRLSKLLMRNPPQSWDSDIIAESSQIGFIAGQDFPFETLPSLTVDAMNAAPLAAHARISEAGRDVEHRQTVNNWWIHTHPGRYHTKYLERAAAAQQCITASLAEDIVCFHTLVDRNGDPLKGTKRYLITFRENCLPPVNSFWSLTIYDSTQHLIPNSVHRYAIRDRDRLRFAPDNSLSLYIQPDWPGESRDSNWLPAPKELFSLVLRMYWPKPQVAIGDWLPPTVIRVD